MMKIVVLFCQKTRKQLSGASKIMAAAEFPVHCYWQRPLKNNITVPQLVKLLLSQAVCPQLLDLCRLLQAKIMDSSVSSTSSKRGLNEIPTKKFKFKNTPADVSVPQHYSEPSVTNLGDQAKTLECINLMKSFLTTCREDMQENS